MDVANSTRGSEVAFLTGPLQLEALLQDVYDQSRQHAQRSEWNEHLGCVTAIVPALMLLKKEDWLARMYGRMAWSYIRLGSEGNARSLLAFAEQHDQWQAAANYYWANEYSERSANPRFARECLSSFRRLCGTLGVEVGSGRNDLELAVEFYRLLSESEHERGTLGESNVRSDIGRYLELRARLNQDAADFEQAAQQYKQAGLHPYAVGCVVFRHLSETGSELTARDQRRSYEAALDQITDAEIFADRAIRDLLEAFLRVAVCVCEIVELSEEAEVEPLVVPEVERAWGKLHKAFFSGGEQPAMAELAARVPSLSLTQAWRDLVHNVDRAANDVCPVDVPSVESVLAQLHTVQRFLPSLSFLAVPEEVTK